MGDFETPPGFQLSQNDGIFSNKKAAEPFNRHGEFLLLSVRNRTDYGADTQPAARMILATR